MFLVRAFLAWFVIMGAEFTHGALRTLFLEPLLGDSLARQVSVLTGSLLILFVAYIVIPWVKARTAVSQFAVGLLWLALTLAVELGFGRYILKLSWEAVAAEFNLLEGGLLPLGLVVLMLSPIIATRLHARFSARGRDPR